MNYDELSDRELDLLAAERVLGMSHSEWWAELYNDYGGKPVLFSRDMSAAMRVVEAMRERVEGFVFDATTGVLGLWEASFLQVLPSDELAGATDEKLLSSVVDESLPRAICIAALRALDEVKV